MKYLLIAVLLWPLAGFGQAESTYHIVKCKHIYVAEYRDSVEYSCSIRGHYMMQHLDNLGGMGYIFPGAGTHTQDHDEKNMAEGVSLVCVKCFHQTRQKIHYKHKDDDVGKAMIIGGSSGASEFDARQLRFSGEARVWSTKDSTTISGGKVNYKCTCAGGLPHVHN